MFAEGGTVGAWASSITVWVCIAVAPVLWVRSYLNARATGGAVDVPGALGLVCVALVFVVGLADHEALETSALIALVTAFGALIVSSTSRWRATRK